MESEGYQSKFHTHKAYRSEILLLYYLWRGQRMRRAYMNQEWHAFEELAVISKEFADSY